MRVLAVGSLRQPLHKVKVVGAVEREGVAVEDVNDQGIVAVGGELVGHQLAVLPDANDVWNVQQSGAVMLLVALGLGDVGIVLADLDDGAGGLAAEKVTACISSCLVCTLSRRYLLVLYADSAALGRGVGGHDNK